MSRTLGASTDRLPAASARSAFRIGYAAASGTSSSESGNVLFEIRYSAGEPAVAHGPLCATVPLVALQSPAIERWTVPAAVRRFEEAGFELASSGGTLVGCATAIGEEIEHDTRELYERMLALVSARGQHLLRVWNIIPRLNERSGELERYMLFCRARAEVFEACWGVRHLERLCAFSAVGSASGPQVLYFLASREPGVPRENPRQVPAWRYPACHGPRSPSFARAMRAPSSLDRILFVSGTASIVGHESRHHDDVAAQARETLRNIRALIGGEEATDRALRDGRFSPVKVYLRCAEDRPIVERILQEELGEETPILYLQADICRPELLVELEGLASEPIDAASAGSDGASS
jgi:chorismate lyase/3-hydroxybenzoate synthase